MNAKTACVVRMIRAIGDEDDELAFQATIDLLLVIMASRPDRMLARSDLLANANWMVSAMDWLQRAKVNAEAAGEKLF